MENNQLNNEKVILHPTDDSLEDIALVLEHLNSELDGIRASLFLAYTVMCQADEENRIPVFLDVASMLGLACTQLRFLREDYCNISRELTANYNGAA